MPQAVAAALASAWPSIFATIGELGAVIGPNVFATIAAYAITATAMSAASYGFGKLFEARAPSFSSEATQRLHVIRSSVQPRRVCYGESMISGALTFRASTSGEGSDAGENQYALELDQAGEVGDKIITLRTEVMWHPHNTIDMTIEKDTEFKITGDEQTYTVGADATGVIFRDHFEDPENGITTDLLRIDIPISPSLQQAVEAGVNTELNIVETIAAKSGKGHEWFHMVVTLAGHELNAIKEVLFNNKNPEDISIISSSVNDPTYIKTSRKHYLTTGDNIKIEGHTGSTPDINGTKYKITYVDDYTFTIEDAETGDPVEVTVAGSGGCCFITRFYHDGNHDSPFFEIHRHLGASDQVADSNLVSRVTEWTDSHRQRGCAYVYILCKFSIWAFPNGIPNVTAIVQGKKLYDPRTTKDVTSSSVANPTVITCTGHGFSDGDTVRIEDHSSATPDINGTYTITYINENSFSIPIEVTDAGTGGTATKIAYSNNWALCMRDYLESDYGLRRKKSQINDTLTISAANESDEMVDLYKDWENTTEYVVNDVVKHGSAVYRCIVGHTGQEPPNDTYWRLGEGTGQQKRYMCDGSFLMNMTPREIILALATAGAATPPVWSEGAYRIIPGAYQTPTVSLDEDDLRGPLQIQPRIKRQDLFNAVRGIFSDADKMWQPTDFPPVTNLYYSAQDDGGKVYKAAWDSENEYSVGDIVLSGGSYYLCIQENTNQEPPDGDYWENYTFKHIWKDIELPFTTDQVMAQRIAKIHLERARQGITCIFPAKLTAWQLAVLDSVQISVDRLGWSSKVFQIRGWTLTRDGGIDLDLQEEASASYNWNYGNATIKDPAPDTDLYRPEEVAAPTGLTLTEEVYRQDGAYLSRVRITWDEVRDYSILHYEIEGAHYGSSNYYGIGTPIMVNWYVVSNVPRGKYTVRIRAVNIYEVPSEWASADITVQGPRAILDPTGVNAPTSPKVFFSADKSGHVNRVTFQCRYKLGARGLLNGIKLLCSTSEWENAVTLGTDGGTTINLSGGEEDIIDSGNLGTDTIKAGSTKSKLIIRDATNPLPSNINLAGHYWCQFTTSEWRKVSRYDDTALYFDEEFDISPETGATINYVAVAWADNREGDTRLMLCKDDDDNYEIIKWGKVDQSGDTFRLINCTREQEGTSQLMLTGFKGHYFPAIGPGTFIIDFPVDSFEEISNGIYEARANADFPWFSEGWASFACMAYVDSDEGYLRSYIVPVIYEGAVQ